MAEEQIVLRVIGDADSGQRAVDKTTKSVKDLQRAQRDQAATAKTTGAQTAAAANQASAAQVAASRRSMAASAAGTAMLTRQRQTIDELGALTFRALRRTTFAAGALTAAGGVIGATFEQEMARVRAITQANEKDFKRLEGTAIRLGQQTKFSAREAASAMYELAAAGFSVDESVNALPGTLSLAAASGIELAQAAEIQSNALRGFRLETKEAGRVADVLAETVNRSSVEMIDLQYSLKFVAPIAKTTGQSFEDVAASLAIMGDAGIKGEQAGTTLRAAMVRLTRPTKMATQGLKAMGLTAEDLQGPNGLKPLPEIIALITEHTKGMEQADRNAAIARIFGTEALSGMVALIDTGAPKIQRLSKELDASDGSARRMARTMNDATAGALEQMTGAAESAAITLFNQLKPALKEAFSDGANFIEEATKDMQAFFDEVGRDPNFLAADTIGEKLKVIGRHLDEAGVPEKLEQLFDDGVELGAQAISDAAPVIAKAMAYVGVKAAEGFVRAMLESDTWGRLLIGGWLLHKLGGIAAIRAAGGKAGATAAGGMAEGMAAAGLGAKTVGLLKRAGWVGLGLAVGDTVLNGINRAIAANGDDIFKALEARQGSPIEVFGVDPIEDVFGASDKTRNAEQLQDVLKEILEDQGALTASEAAQAREKLRLLDLTKQQRDAVEDILDVGQGRQRDLDGINESFDRMRFGVVHNVDTMRQQVDANMKRIRAVFENDPERMKDAMLENLDAAADGIRNSMIEGTISAEDGLREIRRLARVHMKRLKGDALPGLQSLQSAIAGAMDAGVISVKEGLKQMRAVTRQALGVAGFTDKQIDNIMKGNSYTGGPEEGSRGPNRGGTDAPYDRFKAGGGFIGSPGERGRDLIPLMVGRGEAILNGHQQAPVDAALRHTFGFGLGDLFRKVDTPHYMARGGMVTGDTDYNPALGRALESMSRSAGRNIFVQSGGRTIAEQQALFNRYSGQRPVARPSPNAPHVRGVAADITPGREVFGEMARKFGLAFTVPEESWHIELAGGGQGLSGAIGDALAQGMASFSLDLPRLQAAGFSGPMRTLIEGNVNRYASALEQAMGERAGAAGDLSGFSGGGNAQANMALARQMMLAFGFDASEWPALRELGMRESGWNQHATNPSSGAFGIPQALPPTKMGPEALAGDPAAQIAWMLRYIKGRYGSPSAALSFHDRNNWYAEGGFVGGGLGQMLADITGGIPTDFITYAARGLPNVANPNEPSIPGQRESAGRGDQGRKKPKKKRGETPKRGRMPRRKPKSDFPSSQVKHFGDIEQQVAQWESDLSHFSQVYDARRGEYLVDHDDNIETPDVRDEAAISRAVADYNDLIERNKLVLFGRRAMLKSAERIAEQIKKAVAERREMLKKLRERALENARRIKAIRKRLGEIRDQLGGRKGRRLSRERRRALTREQSSLRGEIKGLWREQEILTGEEDPPARQIMRWKDGGAIGNIRDQIQKYQFSDLPEWQAHASEIPNEIRGIVDIDIPALEREIGDAMGTVAPKTDTTDRGPSESDAQRAALLEEQLIEERRGKALSEGQFGVFQDFLQGFNVPFVGAFETGGTIPETGLALMHKGETVIPAGQQVAGDTVIILKGDIGDFVKAEVKRGAPGAADVALGRKSRVLRFSPGG